MDCGVSTRAVSVLVPVALRLATKPLAGPLAVSPSAVTLTSGSAAAVWAQADAPAAVAASSTNAVLIFFPCAFQ